MDAYAVPSRAESASARLILRGDNARAVEMLCGVKFSEDFAQENLLKGLVCYQNYSKNK